MNYQPDFDHDFSRGKVGEQLVDTFLKALEGSTIETKTDAMAYRTGNVYIETWQWRDDENDARPSGINTSKADYWCFASPRANGFVMIQSDWLKAIIKETKAPKATQPISGPKTMASEGRLVRMQDIIRALGLDK